jgi:hypothetical protein
MPLPGAGSGTGGIAIASHPYWQGPVRVAAAAILGRRYLEAPSGAGAFFPPGIEIDRLVGDSQAECRADGSFDQADFTPMRAQ